MPRSSPRKKTIRLTPKQPVKAWVYETEYGEVTVRVKKKGHATLERALWLLAMAQRSLLGGDDKAQPL